ncbi:FliG C-terminal domain-containing protein [Lachnospiraceae bacterium XBB1006]|nr:FliG C-terminal domain-containing protein [Lachnospiraceae bacterium XBB1006]
MAVPDIEMLCILSDYFEVSLDELLDRKTELKRKVSAWRKENSEKRSFSVRTDLLKDISESDDLLIQLILRRLELTDVVHILRGSAYPVCDRIFSNLSLKIARLVIDSLEKSKPEETEIIRAEKKFLEAAEDIRRRVGK